MGSIVVFSLSTKHRFMDTNIWAAIFQL